AGRKPDAGRHRLLRLGDIAAEIAVTNVNEDVTRKLAVLGADRRRPLGEPDRGDFAQRHRAAVRQRHQHVAGDRLWAAAQIARIAHIDGVALAAFDRGGDRIAAERGRDHVLNVTDDETITGEAITVGNYIEIVAADDALSIGA